MNLLIRALRLPRQRKGLIGEALFWTGLARISVWVLPFRWIAPRLGAPMTESPPSVAPERVGDVRAVSWALRAVGGRIPLLGRCLPQAVAGKVMLRRRGLPSTLYLGVNRANGFKAHAWLRCGEHVLTGGVEKGDFTVVMTLGEPGPATAGEIRLDRST